MHFLQVAKYDALFQILKKERTEPDGSEGVYRVDEEDDQVDGEGDDEEIRVVESETGECNTSTTEEFEDPQGVAEQRPKRMSRQESDPER